MMKIFRYILLLAVLVGISCQDDDANRFPKIQSGVNARLIVDPQRSFLNAADLSNTAIAFDVYSINTDLDEIVYTATYTDASSPGTTYTPVEAIRVGADAFVDGKANVVTTAAQLAQALGLSGGAGHFEGGDNITFTARAKLNDGRTFDASNSAPSITGGAASSFTTRFTVYVGCASPSDAITSKRYTADVHFEDSNGGPPFGLIGDMKKTGVTIAFTGPEPFRYTVSTLDAGWFALPDVADSDAGGADFFDICGAVVMQPKGSFCCGGVNDGGGGSYDPATGVIKMNWYNASNDIFGFATYTPEN